MFVILTSKLGQFRTEISAGLRPIEAYDYLFYGQKRAHFVIAELTDDRTRIKVIEDDTQIVNNVPCKFPAGCTVAVMTALPDSSRVYLAGFGFSDDGNGQVFLDVLDTATLTVIASPKMTTVGAMAASPTGKFLYITTGATVSILDTATNAITGSLPFGGFAALGFSPDGSTATGPVAPR